VKDQQEEKRKTIRAINDLGRRVTAADIATRTGLSLADSNKYLNLIAGEVGGHLEVSSAGDIAYRFKNGFQNIYLATGIGAVFENISNKITNILFFIFKISFGLILLLSLSIVVFVIMSFMFMTATGSGRSRGKRELAIDLKIFQDLLFWGTGKSSKRKNFFLNCFSLLFGDGNVNRDVEEKQWQYIAQLIRINSGVITAEQLAPYLFKTDHSGEDLVFPVLTRFDGKPEVSERGSIVYVFPSLQVSAEIEHEQTSPWNTDNLPSYLQEKMQPFSKLTRDEITPVIGLASFNFLGTLWLAFTVHRLVRMYVLQVDTLLTYGLLFVIIPLLRWCYLLRVNSMIHSRNRKRQTLASAVAAPDASLQIKLADREQMALMKSIEKSSNEPALVVYSTDQDALEQEFQQKFQQANKGEIGPPEKEEKKQKEGL